MSHTVIFANGILDIFTSLFIIFGFENHNILSMITRPNENVLFERWYSYYKLSNGLIRIIYNSNSKLTAITYCTETLFLLNEHIFHNTFESFRCSLILSFYMYWAWNLSWSFFHNVVDNIFMSFCIHWNLCSKNDCVWISTPCVFICIPMTLEPSIFLRYLLQWGYSSRMSKIYQFDLVSFSLL